MRARNRQMFGALACVWLVHGLAHAQAPVQLPRVRYEAHAACPAQDVFVERVRARLRVDPTRVPADLELRVTLSVHGAGTHGEVELARGATKTRRSVDAARCEEVVEALALISALALSEGAQSQRTRAPKRDKTSLSERGTTSRTERPVETESQTADATPAASVEAAAASSRARQQAPGDSTRAGSPSNNVRAADAAAERRAAEGPGSDPLVMPAGDPRDRERLARDSRADADASDDARAADAAAVLEDADSAAESGGDAVPLPAAGSGVPSDSEAWQLGAGLAASLIGFTGLAPALQPGLQLQAAFSLGPFSLQLGGRFAFRDRVVSADGDAWFGFSGGVVRVCGSSGLGSSRVALSGCAVAEPGVFSTGAENTENPRSHSRPWLALGAAADASFRVASWLSLRAGAELLAPLRRDRMSLAGYTLYRVPVLGLRLQIGVEVPLG